MIETLPASPLASDVQFKEVLDFPGYGIGGDGSTWTRKAGGLRDRLKPEWSPLLHYVQPSGHHIVRLSRGGKPHKQLVHRLVLEAFVGPCPDGMECCHNDGNPGNNRVENLRWDTHRSNVQDAMKHLPSWHPKGSGHFHAVLTEADIVEMFRLRKAGWKQAEIASRFLVGQPVVSNILNRKTWKHVDTGSRTMRIYNRTHINTRT